MDLRFPTQVGVDEEHVSQTSCLGNAEYEQLMRSTCSFGYVSLLEVVTELTGMMWLQCGNQMCDADMASLLCFHYRAKCPARALRESRAATFSRGDGSARNVCQYVGSVAIKMAACLQ